MGSKTKVDQDFAYSGQPNLKQLEELVDEGYRSVVNLRQEGESDQPLSPSEEGIEVVDRGLEYVNLPFSFRDISADQIKEYCDAIEGLPKPMLVHCQAGRRAGVMLAIYYARAHKLDWDSLFPQLHKFGLENEGHDLHNFIKEKVNALN